MSELLDFFALPATCPKCGSAWMPAKFIKRTKLDQRVDRKLAGEAKGLGIDAETVESLEELSKEPTSEWLLHRCQCGHSMETKTRDASKDPDDIIPPDPNVGPDRGGWKFW